MAVISSSDSAPSSLGRLESRPFLKWAGGKGQLLSELLARVPTAFGKYFEPFLGGGALSFALYSKGRVDEAYLSDANTKLMDTYRAVRDEVEALIRARFERYLADLSLVTRDEFEAAKDLAVRARENEEKLTVRLAELERRVATLEAARLKEPPVGDSDPSLSR